MERWRTGIVENWNIGKMELKLNGIVETGDRKEVNGKQ